MVKTTLLEEARILVGEVRDPEIPSLTIAELGILRDVKIEGDLVIVTITPTYSGCPAMAVITDDIATVLRAGGHESRIETVLRPAWTTDWLSEEAKVKLLAEGVAPPGPTLCPQCSSDDVTVVSEFGSTACQAQFVCSACSEPFPKFKTHQ